MNEYKELIEWYKSTLLFKLSSIGYALDCDLAITDRLELLKSDKTINYISELKDSNKLYIDLLTTPYHYLNFIYNKIKSMNIKLNFYLMTEPNVNPGIINSFLEISYKIYCLNNNFLHPNVHYMPIGIRDYGITIKPQHQDFYHSYLFNEGLNKPDKEYLCLLGGMADTHPDRNIAYSTLKDKEFIFDLSKVSFNINMTKHYGKIPVNKFYNYMNKSNYIIAPRGAGVDTHRFFEAIYLKTIPIVKKTNTPFDKLYEKFPCLIINDWYEITKELLETNIDNLMIKMNNFHNKYPNAYFDISTINELLC